MNSKTEKSIDEELGKWEGEIVFSEYTVELKLERSEDNLEFELPNQDREVMLHARPQGFQIISHYKNEIRKDFSIKYSDIDTIKLLSSFTTDNQPRASFRYILSGLLVVAVIFSFSSKLDVALWLSLGLNFGLILSLYLLRSYRQNLHIKVNDNAGRCNYFFSIHKRDKKACVNFFKRFAGEKFRYD